MHINKIIILILLACASANTSAEAGPKKKPDPLMAMGLFEGIILFNAWVASKNPEVYGSTVALLSPIVATKIKNKKIAWVGLAAAESLAIYNIKRDEDKYSDEANNLSIALIPTTYGGQFKLGYKF